MGLSFLLIEDNRMTNMFHEKLIEKSGMAGSIHISENGLEALEHLKGLESNNCPDIILLDINMPVMDGWEFLVEYEKLPQNKKARVLIIMLTTSPDPDDRGRAKKTELVNDYVKKPLNKIRLKEIVEKFRFRFE